MITPHRCLHEVPGHSSASSLQQGIEVIQQLLAQPPQALAQRCLQLKPEALNSEQRAGQQACRQLLELVRSSANVQVVQAVLPGVDLAQFTGEEAKTLSGTSRLDQSCCTISRFPAIGGGNSATVCTLYAKYHGWEGVLLNLTQSAWV